MVVAIVDDDWALLELTTLFIKKSGHSVFAFSDSEECWEWISNSANICPDVLISDLMMPYYDGRELISMIRGKTHCAHIAVVLVSSVDSVEEQSGLWDVFLQKPYSRESLLESVEQALARRR